MKRLSGKLHNTDFRDFPKISQEIWLKKLYLLIISCSNVRGHPNSEHRVFRMISSYIDFIFYFATFWNERIQHENPGIRDILIPTK